MEKTDVKDKLHSGVNAVGHELEVNESQHVLNKVTLNRNLQNKIMYWYIDKNVTRIGVGKKIIWPKACRGLTLCFPREPQFSIHGSVFTNSALIAASENEPMK